MNQAKVTIGYGIALILLGASGYFAVGGASITALIPAFIGLAVLGLGILALKGRWVKPALYTAAVLALAGLLGNIGALTHTLRWTFGDDMPRVIAQLARAIMAILSLAYLAVFLGGLRLLHRDSSRDSYNIRA